MKSIKIFKDLMNQYLFEDGTIELYFGLILIFCAIDLKMIFLVMIFSSLPALLQTYKKKITYQRIGRFNLSKDNNNPHNIFTLLTRVTLVFSLLVSMINITNTGFLFSILTVINISSLLLILLSIKLKNLLPAYGSMLLICFSFLFNVVMTVSSTLVIVIIISILFLIIMLLVFLKLKKQNTYLINNGFSMFEKVINKLYIMSSILLILINVIIALFHDIILKAEITAFIINYNFVILTIVSGLLIGFFLKNMRILSYTVLFIILFFIHNYQSKLTLNQATLITGFVMVLTAIIQMIRFIKKHPVIDETETQGAEI